MKVLVTGAKGQLGHDIMVQAKERGIDAVGVDVAEMDITRQNQVEEVISRGDYDAVIHCAAWTQVDKGEDQSAHDRRGDAAGLQELDAVGEEAAQHEQEHGDARRLVHVQGDF